MNIKSHGNKKEGKSPEFYVLRRSSIAHDWKGKTNENSTSYEFMILNLSKFTCLIEWVFSVKEEIFIATLSAD